MSILANPAYVPVIFAGAIIVSVTGAAVCRVFVPGSIDGPQRLDEDESPRLLATIAFMGLLSFLMIRIILDAARSLWFKRYRPGQPVPEKYSDFHAVVLEIVIFSAIFATMLALSVLWRRQGVQRLGLQLSNIIPGFWRGLMGIIILFPFILLVNAGSDQLWTALHWNHSEHELLQIFKQDTGWWVRALVVLSATVIAPLTEEMFFRAHVQTILRYLIKRPWPAVLITAALFAALHPWWSMPAIFVLAVGLGYLYERFGNLWACIFLHCMFNSIMLLLFYYTTISHPL